MSLPWFPFNIKDFVTNTLRLNTEAKGAYLMLILDYYQTETAPPDDDEVLAAITGLSIETWQRHRRVIAPLFQIRDGVWHHPEIAAIRAQCQANYERVAKRHRTLCDRRPSVEDWLVIRSRVFARDGYICTYCGSGPGGDLECDHIIPIVQGGSNDDDNLTTACKPCNRSKGPRTIEQWRAAS